LLCGRLALLCGRVFSVFVSFGFGGFNHRDNYPLRVNDLIALLDRLRSEAVSYYELAILVLIAIEIGNSISAR
jgi:hypothetical protein